MSPLRIDIRKIVVVMFIPLSCAIFSTAGARGQHGLERSSASEQSKVSDTQSLPDGKGRDLLFQACIQCHDFKSIVSQRKTLAGWRRTVDEMVWRGAPLMDGEADTIANYLATSFGLDKRADPVSETASTGSEDTDNLARYLPKGEGRALVLQSCVKCHDLRKTVAARKTPAEWRRTVNEMVRLGASPGSGNAETVINYLVKSFGPDKPLPEALKVD
jgi:mono/diheme cytochrome c family protein